MTRAEIRVTTGGSSPLESLAQLAAYAVEADGRVSPEELETLQEFLRQRYAGSSRAQFFTLFRQAVANRPDIERILSAIHESLPGAHDRLEVYATIQTLLAAAGMTAEESYSLGKIESLLDIDPVDADLLANASTGVPVFRFPVNRDRFLRVGADPVAGALSAARALRFAVMDLAGVFAVASASAELVVADVAHPAGEIVFVKPGDRVVISSATITYADLSRLFDLAKTRAHRTLELVVEGDRLVSVGSERRASIEFRVADGQLTLLVLDRSLQVHLNRQALTSGAVLVPGDILRFARGEIAISQLLDTLDQASWPLTKAADRAFRYQISDRSTTTGAEHVLSDVGGPLSITIAESNDAAAALSVVLGALPPHVQVMLGDKPVTPNTAMPVASPATLRIGHHWFLIDPHLLKVDYAKRVVERFEARQMGYRFRNAIGLAGITFVARSGELVGIMGGSGAGKSTLLNVLLGVLPPHEGRVLLNGVDLGAQLQRRRSILGYVPQDDLVMDSLTVEENLYYSGRIRLPDLADDELRGRVARVLHDVGLFEKKDLRVGNPVAKVLSGGQRKRLNIGLELLADPELFFLDEPTSGLSSQDSKAIMGLLSQLTRRGKLVFVVIHQPSSDIYKMLDTLLVLDTGGVLVWYGPARDAVSHFKAFLPSTREFVECPACGSINPETVLNAIEQPASALEAPTGAASRRFDPVFWQNAFLLKSSADPAAAADTAMPLPSVPRIGLRGKARALGASVHRAFLDRARNRTNIVMSIAAPLILGAAMAAMLRGPDEPYTYSGNTALGRFLFLSTIVFVFFGLMASVNEVIRELALIRRERIAGFKPTPYIAAKTLAFLPFSLLQVAIYAGVTSWVLRFPYHAPAYLPIQPLIPFPWYFGIILFLVVQASFALGLLLSTFLRTQAAAFNWIPLVIIPQILLGGVFVEFSDLPKFVNRVVPEYAEVTFSRWGYEALLAGEKAFNPSDHLNADAILVLRDRLRVEGKPFDMHELIEAPRDRWRSERGLALPPARISASVMQDTLIKLLRVHDQSADVETLEHAYERVDRRSYVQRPGLSAPTTARVESILMGADTGWWGSSFSSESVNAMLESERVDANAPDPVRVSTLRQLLTDRSDFPAISRAVGDVQIPVVLWNALVLVAMTLGCHILSVLRLRYSR